MIRYLKLTLIIFLAVSTTNLLSVCPEMEIWSDGKSYRYLIKDFHRDYIDGRLSIKQQADILWAAQQKKSKGSFVLAEDTMGYPGPNKKIQEIFQYAPRPIAEDIAATQRREGINPEDARGSKNILNSFVTPLACMINACKKLGIRKYNTECSQAIDIYQWQNLPEDKKLTKQDVISDLTKTSIKIANHPLLRDVNDQITKELQVLTKIAFSNASNNNEENFINKAMEIRSVLLKAKTINQLIKWNHIKHGFICEGGRHIEDIKDALIALRYKHIESIGNPRAWDYPGDKQAQQVKKLEEILTSALDLKKVFKQIFEKAT